MKMKWRLQQRKKLDVRLANTKSRGFGVGGGPREKEDVEKKGGYWSAYLDTLFREQEPRRQMATK
jgi:hypothetical protein